MPKHAYEIVSGIYLLRENMPFDCNVYLLKDSCGNHTLIDMGNGSSWDQIKDVLKAMEIRLNSIKNIIITHEHPDHILGLYAFLASLEKYYGALSDNHTSNFEMPKVYAHPYTVGLIKEAKEDVIFPRVFQASAADFGVEIIPFQNTVEVGHESDLNIGDFCLKTLHTPGHSRGSACFYEKTLKILFCGDVLFPEGGYGRYDFPGSSYEELCRSIDRLVNLDVDILCAGHMSPIRNGANQSIARSKANL